MPTVPRSCPLSVRPGLGPGTGREPVGRVRGPVDSRPPSDRRSLRSPTVWTSHPSYGVWVTVVAGALVELKGLFAVYVVTPKFYPFNNVTVVYYKWDGSGARFWHTLPGKRTYKSQTGGRLRGDHDKSKVKCLLH